MSVSARFAHNGMVARDWRKPARFYEEVFVCAPVPPERDLSGRLLEKATGISDARLRGIQLRLPWLGSGGPALEIFQYDEEEVRPPTAVNRPGFALIAFVVDDVEAGLGAVKKAGGGAIGEIVSLLVAGAGTITLVYATDPEDNIIELQSWSREMRAD